MTPAEKRPCSLFRHPQSLRQKQPDNRGNEGMKRDEVCFANEGISGSDSSMDPQPRRRTVPSFLHFFISSFLHFFIPSFLHSFIPSFLHFFVPSFLRSFIPSFLRSFIPSFLRSFVPSFLRSFISSFLRSFVPSFLHSFIPSFLHFFIPSFLHFFPSQQKTAPGFPGAVKDLLHNRKERKSFRHDVGDGALDVPARSGHMRKKCSATSHNLRNHRTFSCIMFPAAGRGEPLSYGW